MMRAVLAAWATTATLTGRLASRPRIQGEPLSGLALTWRSQELAPRMSSLRRSLSPARLIWPVNLCLPPVSWLLRVRPSQAAKSLPEVN